MRPIYSVVAAAATFLGAVAVGDRSSLQESRAQAVANKQVRGTVSVRPLTLDKVIDHSKKIFSGVCTEIKEGLDVKAIEEGKEVTLKAIATEFTFKIEQGIKGVMGGEIKFRQWNGIEHYIEKGKKYVLFLPAPSTYGFSSPVGFQYGQCDVYKKDNEKGEFVFSIHKEHGYKGKEFKYEDFIKTVNDTIAKQDKNKK